MTLEDATLNMADTAAKREPDSVATDELTQKVKRAKTDSENGRGEVGEESEINILSGFQTSAVLSDSAREKNIFIRGKVAN